MPERTLFLMDAHAVCYRSFYAIPEMRTSKGQATNAVYGFVNTLKKILKEFEPIYFAVCFDSKGKTNRQKKFADYKISRPTMPEDLQPQIPIIKEILKAYHLAIFEKEGFEADDLIATITAKMAQENIKVVIISDDKDMYQLAGENVKFLSTKNNYQLMGLEDIRQRYGFGPEYIVDFIGLAGDPVDDIPGVKGIGEVYAKQLIGEYGHLGDILTKLETTPSGKKVHQLILDQKQTALMCRDLAILEKEVLLSLDLEQLRVKGPDRDQLFAMFKEFEFKKWANEMSPPEELHAASPVVRNEKDLEKIVQTVQAKGQFVFAVSEEADDLLTPQRQIALGVDAENIWSVDYQDVDKIKSLFADKKILKVTYNLKHALKVLETLDCSLAGESFDIMLAGYLLDQSRTSFQLNNLAWAYLKKSVGEQIGLSEKSKLIEALYPRFLKELKEKSLLDLLKNVEIPLTFVLRDIEKEGVCIDRNWLEKLSQESDQKIKELETKLYKMAGGEFNLNSPKQLCQVLFERLKLPVIKKTKTGYSTDESVLIKLGEQHEFPALILEYRQLAKLKSTYIDALPKLVDPKTQRIHAEFDQTGTETGRLSSRNPNLQNIPIRTELGRQVRKAIVTCPEHILIAADYSQIELRILAHLSKDKNLIQAFQEDQDIHQATAALIFDVAPKDVTTTMRYAAKRVNFGIVYGMSAFGLSKDLKISQGEAQDFIDRYFERYAGVKQYMDDCIEKCEKDGYVVTLLNRRRYIPDIKNINLAVRNFAQRQAINTPVQGSAADLIKLAMINIHQRLAAQKLQAKMTMSVHDELVFNVPVSETQDLFGIIRKEMEHPVHLLVPIKVCIQIGNNWLEMKDIPS
jgi:DNA polymerase-1